MRTIFFCVSLLLIPTSLFARSHRTDDVPNATDALFNPGGNDCGLCHVRESGGGSRTVFGTAVEIQVEAVSDPAPWNLVYDLDSDRDGYPNGLELGDPMGLFTEGDNDPDGPISDPNDPDSNLCGDGTLHDGIEVCDSDADVTAVCADMGYGAGTETCNQCLLDFSGCEGFVPSNNTNPNNVNNSNNVNNANNLNNVNNNTTASNNQTDGETNNPVNNDGDENSDEGCSTTGGVSPLGLFLIALIALRSRRRR